MALLIGFAFVAGAGTALSPCVLPVLPVALSAGATGGRRRPLGIVTGLALSFTFATVALVYVIDALGLPNDLLRTVAIVALVVFGATLAVPPLAAKVEALLSRLTRRAAPARGGDGFGSGLLVGASLGLVYAPCAGPILAGVITVSASQSFTAGRLATAFAYGLGSAVALYALMLLGRRFTRRLAAASGRFQQALGAVMVVVALLMLLDLDTRFQTAIAKDLPSFVVNPTRELEEVDGVASELADFRRGRRAGAREGGARQAASDSPLPVLGQAPELAGLGRWFNSPPLTLAGLRARRRVVLIDFWTYTCINCIRTLPHVTAWDRRYAKEGLTVIGVHTPEFPFEKEAGNVATAVRQNGIRYPVAQDNDYGTWNAFANQYWPAKYLIDAGGRVRFAHFGEGEYDVTERAIRSLLAEAGTSRLGGMTHARAQVAADGVTTPETYLGSARAQGWQNGAIRPGAHDYGAGRPRLDRDEFAYRGGWTVGPESARAGAGGSVHARFKARRVFLVLGSPGRARTLRVMLDGRPIPARLAGADVDGGEVRIRRHRLYRLVDLPRAEEHVLTLQFARGVEGYAFTFG
jgi:cytochrome c biogenesis protein CcdA/thiol-disulfide isomerase/thioredoxin